MLKINAHLTRKLPVPGIEYSSQSYAAGLEVEVADAAVPAEIRERIRQIYATLEQAIDEEIKNRQAPEASASEGRNAKKPSARNNSRKATAAQVKAILAISRSAGIERKDLLEWIGSDYSANRPDDLTVLQASEVIEKLKLRQAG